MSRSLEMTVRDAKALALNPRNLEAGTHCLVCERLCKAQPRRFSYWWGLGLLALYQFHKQNPQQEFCHLENLYSALQFKIQQMRDISRLKHWGLIVHAPVIPGSVVQGHWKITETGIAFVCGKLLVPERCKTYNDDVTVWGEKKISIYDVLGSTSFNLGDLVALKGLEFFRRVFPAAYAE